MKSVIVGTAGHIDHGKTALVKALTGIDADRLEEEKRRGITIDLGFAHLELSSHSGERLRFGFVDVPGHERFVRNMLAGVGGMDLVLLVIAADEGIKPQTREHFDICRLLSIPRGITVLTKSELVDSETLDVVRLELQEFLRGSFLEGCPVVAVSSLQRTGLDELKRQLIQAAETMPARDASAITRLPIDRVFTMKGFGTVVTGTLVAGAIRREDELELFPSKRRVRVRGVQVHGAAADQAVAGERTAVNLAGVEKQDVERGMTLASPGLLETTSRLDVRLSLLSSARPIQSGARVHLHAFTSEVIATINLLAGKQLQPGEEAFTQLRLSAPLLLVPGDRFIIRQFSPVITVGGGVVLDAFPIKRTVANHSEFLRVVNSGEVNRVLLARITRRGQDGILASELIRETGQSQSALQPSLSALLQSQVVARRGEFLMEARALQQLADAVTNTVSEFHAANRLAPGISKEALREQARASQASFEAALAMSLAGKKLALTGDVVHLPGRGVVMQGEESESRKTIAQAFASAGLKVPALKDVLAGLKIDKARAQQIVTLLLRERVLVKVSDDLVFHASALQSLRAQLAAEKQKSQRIDVARFKDLTGVSRKYAIPLLEYLDRERVTKRIGDERVIL
jgi:selenocysteine-specific elongation factor